jgi:CYTH domain-containing protein
MEIERKFLLRAPPPATRLGPASSLAQGYVVDAAGAELRLRSAGERCWLTVKAGAGLARREWEQELPRWAFDALWPATAGRRIEKRRYRVAYAGSTLEIDVFEGELAGLCVVECEAPSEAAAAALTLPPWLEVEREVTNDPAYTNRRLARDGRR